MNNYQPISLLSVISKINEKLFVVRITSFLKINNLFVHNQFGFREGRSTMNAVAHLVVFISESLNNYFQTLSVSFWTSFKAFDCVDLSVLFVILERYGIRGVPLRWIQSFLSGRFQWVQFAGKFSNSCFKIWGPPGICSRTSGIYFICYSSILDALINILMTPTSVLERRPLNNLR